MAIDFRRPSFAFLLLCQIRPEVELPIELRCEIDYEGVAEGISRDVRAYLVGSDSLEPGENGAIVVGFLEPDAHSDKIKAGDRVHLRRGPVTVGTASVVFTCQRTS